MRTTQRRQSDITYIAARSITAINREIETNGERPSEARVQTIIQEQASAARIGTYNWPRFRNEVARQVEGYFEDSDA